MDEFLKQAWRANKIYTNATASVPLNLSKISPAAL